MKKSPIGAATFLAAAYLVFGLLSLDQFGITWDEPAPDHFYVGDLYLDTLHTGDWRSLTAGKIGRSMENYGPVFDLIGALNARVFHARWDLLSEDNARHLHLVFTASLTVFFTCLLAGRAWSVPAGIFSALFLCAFPRFISDTFNNPKDNPVVFAYILCFYLYHRRLQTDKKVYSIMLSLAAGLGFATRATFAINPGIILIYTILYLLAFRDREISFIKRLISFWDVWLALAMSLPMGMLLWPYLWHEPLTRLKEIAEFYFFHETQAKLRILYQGRSYIPGLTMPWHYAPVMLFITTPLITLGAAFWGLSCLALRHVGAAFAPRSVSAEPVGAASRRDPSQVETVGRDRDQCSGRLAFGLFLIVWIVFGILPFVLPGQRVYDGIRHFLFVAPAICILAGLGLECVMLAIARRARRVIAVTVITALYLLLFLNVFEYHPDYTVYYNALVGGPRGAFERYSLDYWGNSYKRGMEWINRNVPPRSSVLVMVAPQIARFYARPDLIMLGPEELNADPRLRFDYSMYVIRDGEALRQASRGPVFQIVVKGQPILKIHQWR
jgi:4-amino-4-deoxy-L-arabinose transferase-like glycosyltransferase